MDNENCDDSVYSVDKESIHVEHDYCRAEVTCHTGETKDHGLGEKFTEHVVEKWTDGPSVQVRNDNDCNKCGIPAVMGEVLSRASTIFGVTPNNLSKGRKEASAETPLPAAEPEESSEIKSHSRSISEYETPSADVHRNAPDDSGMISQESELSESITPDFEFLRDVPTQPQPAQRLTPVLSPPACRQAIALGATRDTSIHSQSTQILTGGRELPNFQHAFGSMLSSNFSNSSSPPPSLTPHYPSSDTHEGVVDPGTQCDNSNNASPPSLTPSYPLSDSERTVRADTSEASDADFDLDTQHESSKRDSPPLFSTQNYPPSDNQETAHTDVSNTRGDVVDLETQYENSKCGSPPLFFNRQRTIVRVDVSELSGAVIDLETQYDNSNSDGSPPLFSTQNYPPSDNQETALTDTSDTRRAVIDLERQYDNSNSDGSSPLFSTQNYPPSDNQETALTDTSDTREAVIDVGKTSDARRAVIDLETQYDNSNSDGSAPLFSTPNYPPSDNQETALTDTSDTRVAVIDLETQHENSNTGSPVPSFIQDRPSSDRQGTSVTDLSDNGSGRSVWQYLPRSSASRTPNHKIGVVDLETRYENSDSKGSPPPFSDTSDTRQEVVDLYTRYENSDSSDSMLAQSNTSNLESSDIRRVIDREIGYEKFTGSEVTSSAPTDLESTDAQRVIDGSELTGSTASVTEFLDTRCGLDNEDLPTQTRSPFRRDVNENLIARNKEQTPKRKREEEPESLWTDEDYSQSGSPVLEIMSNNLGRLSKLAADSCAISIGTNLPAPGFLNAPAQSPENVNLDHSYSERTRKSSDFCTLELDGSNDAHGEAVETRTVAEFTGSDTSNLRNFGRRRVRKIEKRKIDFNESKENRPAKKRRVSDETMRRSIFESKESPANLNVPRECDRTGSIEFSEGLLSNRCCEYDHVFPNVTSIDNLLYEPILLRPLVEPDYEAIKRKIDALVTRIEALSEDL